MLPQLLFIATSADHMQQQQQNLDRGAMVNPDTDTETCATSRLPQLVQDAVSKTSARKSLCYILRLSGTCAISFVPQIRQQQSKNSFRVAHNTSSACSLTVAVVNGSCSEGGRRLGPGFTLSQLGNASMLDLGWTSRCDILLGPPTVKAVYAEQCGVKACQITKQNGRTHDMPP